MTSLAFILGVAPLMIATRASAKSQQALGAGVFGGMVSATLLTVVFVPVFFVAVMAFFIGRQERRKAAPAAAQADPAESP
ncbi:multidrug efflux pump subunit AcrB [Rhodoblastus sphagnicola]|nr:multidrug efflux pump subunit AcrB [Rhodoblastus sphagnicola]